MSLRFLHTSDWQLGMTRHFLSEGAQERYSQARFDANPMEEAINALGPENRVTRICSVMKET